MLKDVMRELAVLDLETILDQIEKEMKQAPSHKQWAMNHCLAEIGIRHPTHRNRAIAIGERLPVLIDYPASPGCTSPCAPAWIAEMVRRHEETGPRARGRGRDETAVRLQTGTSSSQKRNRIDAEMRRGCEYCPCTIVLSFDSRYTLLERFSTVNWSDSRG